MKRAIQKFFGTQYGLFKVRLKKDTQQDLTNFYSASHNALVIMPNDPKSAEIAVSVVRFLEKKFPGRNCIVIASPQSANLVSKYTGAEVVRIREGDENFFQLPRKSFSNRFSKRQYDLVIDLNLGFDLFASYLCNRVVSRHRVSFAKEHGDWFYNIQYRYSPGQNKQLIYNSLCEFLEKF